MPDVQQALVKTHRLTIVLATPLASTLGQLKENVVSALNQFEDEESAAGVPKVSPGFHPDIVTRKPVP